MTLRPCPGWSCDRALRESEFLCRNCLHKAERALADLAALTRDLEVTTTRQDRVTVGGKRGTGTEPPLPVNLAADQRGRDTLELLFEWTDYIALWHGVKGLPLFARHIRLTELVPSAVALLLRYSEWMRSNEQGPMLADAVHAVRRNLMRLVDQRPARLYAGPCGADLDYPGYRCGLPLFREWGRDDIICDGHNPDRAARRLWTSTGCGTVHPAVDRSVFLLAAVEETLLPLRLLWESLYLLVPGTDLDWKTVQRWTKPRTERVTVGTRVRVNHVPPRLDAVSIDQQGVPLFRGGDVLALARDSIPRRGRRRTRGAA